MMSAKLPFQAIMRYSLPFILPLLVACTSTPTSEHKVLFRLYKPVQGFKEILDWEYLLPMDELPLLVELEGHQLTIVDLSVQKRTNGGFNVSMPVEFQGEERNLGFWHGRDPTAAYYSEENGCILNVALFCQEECSGIDICGGYDCTNPEGDSRRDHSANDCAGVQGIEIERWTEPPNREESAEGIEEILFMKWIYLSELDYDYRSDEWNFVKIILGLYREEKIRPIVE